MSTVPPGTSSYNWLAQQQKKTVINTSGLQLTQLKASSPKAICGRMIDSSVAVGGVGGIPITPSAITPDLIQGHAFVAPTYHSPDNLLLNPTAMFGFSSWGQGQARPPGVGGFATDSFNGGRFIIGNNGGQSVDALLVQQVNGIPDGSVMTMSGMIGCDEFNDSGSGAIIGVEALGLNVDIIAQFLITAVQDATFFQFTFTMPSNPGLFYIRLHLRNSVGGTSSMRGYFSQLNLEYGSTATAFSLAAFDALTEVDISGVLQSIIVSVGFTNIPMNATKVLWLFKNTLSQTWIAWAETTIPGLPYPPSQQILTFGYGQLSLGIHYDFGAAYVDLQGNIGAISIFVAGFNPNASLFQVSSSYMLTFNGTFSPTFASTPFLHSILSANGIASAVTMDFTINNQPTDGSLSRVSLWYRVTGQAKYTFYGSVPAVGVGLPLASLPTSGTYSFTFTDLTNSTSYDFAVSCEDSSGRETAIVFANTMTPQAILLPTGTLPTAPANAFVNAVATSVEYGPTGQAAYYAQLSLTVTVRDGPFGVTIDATSWLAQINILARPQTAGERSSGQYVDFNPNDYTLCNTIYTNNITSPINVVVGPFPANVNQVLAVELIDQAGKPSNADPFEIALPPNQPMFSANGIYEISQGVPISQLITPAGTLQPGTVARLQMAAPPTGNNLIFNPTGFFGTQYWLQYGGTGSNVPIFLSNTFNGGRFRLYYGPTGLVDWVAEQTLSNFQPGWPMVLSGSVEIDTFNARSGGYVALEAFDPISGVMLAAATFTAITPVLTGPVYVEKAFVMGSSGAVQIRMHIYNAGGGTIDTYWYKLQLEHGTRATPFNDAMASSAAANTHTPSGTVSISVPTVTNGRIDYDASPAAIKAVIASTSTYNGALITPGSTVPYAGINGAYQIATGPNGQLLNGLISSYPTIAVSSPTIGSSIPLVSIPSTIQAGIPPSIPAGTWQFTITANAPTVNTRIEISVTGSNGVSPPAGMSNVVNCNTFTPAISGGFTVLSASFTVTGGQVVTVMPIGYFPASGSSCGAGVVTIQATKIG